MDDNYILSNEPIGKNDSFIGILPCIEGDKIERVLVTTKNKDKYKGSGTFVMVKKVLIIKT